MTEVGAFELIYLDPVALHEGLTYSKAKRRQNKEESTVRGLQHEQRRRKFLRQQDTSQQKLARDYFENEVIGQLLNRAGCEKEEDETKEHVLRYRQLIPLNRKNREMQIDMFQEADRNYDKSWTRVEARREISWVLYLDTSSQNYRRTRLLDARTHASRHDTVSFVQGFLTELVDAVLWAITCREVGCFDFIPSAHAADPADLSMHMVSQNASRSAADVIPALLLKDVRALLASPLPSPPPLANLKPMLASSMMVPFNISERPRMADKDWLLRQVFSAKGLYGEAADYAGYLASEDRAAHLLLLNEVAAAMPSAARSSGQGGGDGSGKVSGERDAALTPAWLLSAHPVHILGSAVVDIRCTNNPIPAQPQAPVSTKHIPLRGALFGVSSRMRDEVAVALAKAVPRLTVLRVEDMVRASMDSDAELREHLATGSAVPDPVYVRLIVQRIASLEQVNNGFLLVDFPSTLEQLLLLMEALSGVRYDRHMPQAADYASPYAPISATKASFDVSHCGLDMVFCADDPETAVSDAISERVAARRDLTTQQIVKLTADRTSVRHLQTVYDPTRPVHTTALQVTTAEQHARDVAAFCAHHELLVVRGSTPLEEQVQQIAERYVPAERLSEEYWPVRDLLLADTTSSAEVAERMVGEEVQCGASVAAAEALAEVIAETPPPADEQTPAEGVQPADAATPEEVPAVDSAPPAAAPPPHTPVLSPSVLHPTLSQALGLLWQLAEQTSDTSSGAYHASLRDIRLQMLQRRRLAIDSINGCMMRLDDRQDMFNKFRADFNAIDDELRFDPDCIAELHLRTLQFRNELGKLCEVRSQEMCDVVQAIVTDNNAKVFQHRCSCEAAFALQADYNRFYIALQVILDYGKAMQGYELRERIRNDLEALLPIAMDGYEAPQPPGKPAAPAANAKDAKKDSKKSKEPPAGREVLAPYLLAPHAMVQGIPTARTHEEPVVDPKAKGKKDKKGAEEAVPSNPLEALEAAISADLSKWKAFTVNRELFDGDEALCVAIESAVWFETDKMAQSMKLTREGVDRHISWLAACEEDFIALLTALSHDRYLRELAAGEKVIDLIESCIANAEPLDSLWLVTPDACAPVIPGGFWKKWRYLVPFVWLKQYEKGLRKRVKRLMSKMNAAEGKGGSSANGQQAGSGAGANAGLAGIIAGSVDDDDSSDSDDDDDEHHGANPKNGKAAKKGKPAASKTPAGRGAGRGAGRPNSGGFSIAGNRTGSAGKRAQSPGHRLGSGSTEAHAQRLRSPSVHAGSSHSRPSSGTEDALAREQERYQHQKYLLEQKLLANREAREAEFRDLGMSPSAAKLAAFNELLLEEQHQLADLEAQWKPALQRMRPRSNNASRGGSSQAKRPGAHR